MKPTVEQIPVPTLPQAPSAPPVISSQPMAQKPQSQSMSPSYLNTATSVPSKANLGTKKLVGQ